MINIKRRKVKAVYHNAFCCPECGLELHKDNVVLTTYPAQYCYYCDCGFRTTSSQTPGIEYEFEDEKEPSVNSVKENSAIHISRQCEIPEKFCPTCGEKLDGEVMKVYNRTCFLYDCPNGCKLKSSEAYVYTDEDVITYKIEDEDLPSVQPERIAQIFSPCLENGELDTLKSFVHYIHTTDPAIVENTSYAIDNFTVSTEEAIENILKPYSKLLAQ